VSIESKATEELQRLKPCGSGRFYVVAEATTHKDFRIGAQVLRSGGVEVTKVRARHAVPLPGVFSEDYLPAANSAGSSPKAPAPRGDMLRRRVSMPRRLIFWFSVESGTWKRSDASV
jgi:hypothetical protein